MAAAALHYSGALAVWRRFLRGPLGRKSACVLGLHRVLGNQERARSSSVPAMIVSEATFDKVLEYLSRHFRFISLDALLSPDGLDAKEKKALCAITFDDGWRDTYSTAFPLLKKHGAPAAVLVTTGTVGTKGGFWIERLRRNGIPANAELPLELGPDAEIEQVVEWLKHMPGEQRERRLRQILGPETDSEERGEGDAMLSWTQMAEMSRDGVEIGAHTVSHPLLVYEDDATMKRELEESKRSIEERLRKPVRAFAYPNGDWDERVRKGVVRAGYRCAFTTRPGWFRLDGDFHTIPRILLHEENVTGPGGNFSPAMLDLTLAGWR
jgi:peptidoglycan/xylan/chitin deacetylase (PgdA/CDA1 family)